MYNIEEEYKNKLDGTTVLVHPALQNDPSKHQGMVGRIDFSDLKADEMYVNFDHQGPLSLYSMDALLILKPHQQFQGDLETPSLMSHLNNLDQLVLKRVENLMVNGGHARDLLEIVKTNEAAISLATISLQEDYKLAVKAMFRKERVSAANSLLGEVVIVNPNSVDIAPSKQGLVGLISRYDDHNMKFSVEFSDGRSSLFRPEDLLTLKPANELYRKLLTTGKELDEEDFKNVMKANLLQESGGKDKTILDTLRSSITALDFSTNSLADRIQTVIDKSHNYYQSSLGR